nr:MAG TPA: hypothetical protein [Caudoviricetes sp.]
MIVLMIVMYGLKFRDTIILVDMLKMVLTVVMFYLEMGDIKQYLVYLLITRHQLVMPAQQ